MCVHACVCVHVCMSVCVCTHVHAHVCLCVSSPSWQTGGRGEQGERSGDEGDTHRGRKKGKDKKGP